MPTLNRLTQLIAAFRGKRLVVFGDLIADEYVYGRVARVYPDDGHIAAKNEREWGPASWAWLRGVLTKGMKPAAKRVVSFKLSKPAKARSKPVTAKKTVKKKAKKAVAKK